MFIFSILSRYLFIPLQYCCWEQHIIAKALYNLQTELVSVKWSECPLLWLRAHLQHSRVWNGDNSRGTQTVQPELVTPGATYLYCLFSAMVRKKYG